MLRLDRWMVCIAGMLVAEKGGIVYVVRGSQRWPMWVGKMLTARFVIAP